MGCDSFASIMTIVTDLENQVIDPLSMERLAENATKQPKQNQLG